MSDSHHLETLSALHDDQPGNDDTALLESLIDSPQLQQKLARYQLISDALQHRAPSHATCSVLSDVQKALQDEPCYHIDTNTHTTVSPPDQLLHLPVRKRPRLASMALAASVAAITIATSHMLQQEAPSAQVVNTPVLAQQTDTPPAASAIQSVQLASTPQTSQHPTQTAQQEQDLYEYLLDHNRYSYPAPRSGIRVERVGFSTSAHPDR